MQLVRRRSAFLVRLADVHVVVHIAGGASCGVVTDPNLEPKMTTGEAAAAFRATLLDRV